MNEHIMLKFNIHTNVQIMLNFNTICTAICIAKRDYFIAVSIKLFGCELSEDGDQPQHVGAR
jgi:hypothetical protein